MCKRQTSYNSPLQSNADVWSFRYKFPGPSAPEGGPWPDYVAYVFVFLGNIIYLSTVQINPFRPSPGHSATDSLSDVMQQFFGGPPLAGQPEPAIADLATKMNPRKPSL